MSGFTHSTKAPKLYKAASKITCLAQEKHQSIKELVFSNKYRHFNTKALYALTVETVQHADILDQLIAESKVIIEEPALDPWLVRVLLTELLWGKKKLPDFGYKPINTILSRHDNFIAILKAAVIDGTHENKPRTNRALLKPRYVRVNTLAISVGDAVTMFRQEGWKRVAPDVDTYEAYLTKAEILGEREYMQDCHVKEVFVFPPGTEFHEHEMYTSGWLVLQDKATSLAPFLLDPPPGSRVLDMCAAPGIKTTHLAAIMRNQGTLYAVERDVVRYKTLCDFVERHAVTCVEAINADASTLTPMECADVEYVLVDPTCSSSGMQRSGLEVLPESRLAQLAKFQVILLEKALTAFPDVKRVVYSTCSVSATENEEVVEAVLKIVNPDPDHPNYELMDPPTTITSRGSDQYEYGPKCLFFSPDRDKTTGFFVAVFQRVGNTSLEGLSKKSWRGMIDRKGRAGRGKWNKAKKQIREKMTEVVVPENVDVGEGKRRKEKKKNKGEEGLEKYDEGVVKVNGGEKRKKVIKRKREENGEEAMEQGGNAKKKKGIKVGEVEQEGSTKKNKGMRVKVDKVEQGGSAKKNKGMRVKVEEVEERGSAKKKKGMRVKVDEVEQGGSAKKKKGVKVKVEEVEQGGSAKKNKGLKVKVDEVEQGGSAKKNKGLKVKVEEVEQGGSAKKNKGVKVKVEPIDYVADTPTQNKKKKNRRDA